MRIIFTLLSDLLRFGERKFAVFGIIAFSKILTLESMYVLGEGAAAAGSEGSSPLDKPVTLLIYLIELISMFLLAARWKTVARPLLRDPFLLLLGLMAPVSDIWSDFPGHSKKRGISTILTATFGLYLASRYSLREQAKIVGQAMGIISVFSFLFTLARPGAGISVGKHAGAWRGPLGHKNLLAQLMCVATPILLLKAMDSRQHRLRDWTIFGIAALLVVLTTSKTGLLILFNIIILVPLFKAWRLSSGILIPFLTLIVLITGSVTTWLVTNWEPFLYGLGKDPTLSGRTDLWQAAIDKITERPWLGYGYQAFWQDTGAANYIWKVVMYQAPHAHNGFVNISLDLGLVGLFLFLMSVLTTLIRGLILLRLSKTSLEIWPLIYMSFLILYNQTESTIIEHNSVFWVLHVAVSLSVGYFRRLRPEELAERQKKSQNSQVGNINYASKGAAIKNERSPASEHPN